VSEIYLLNFTHPHLKLYSVSGGDTMTDVFRHEQLKLDALEYKIKESVNIPVSLESYVNVDNRNNGVHLHYKGNNKELLIQFNTFTDEFGVVEDNIGYTIIKQVNLPILKGRLGKTDFVTCISILNSWLMENEEVLAS
jgi:hypothetical protein